ncbi:MAG: PGPGW domain-containing protein [Acidimicrobiia bacterium]|nr:PGPGW domain-containing protein [Acidimicrobiia bacterium]
MPNLHSPVAWVRWIAQSVKRLVVLVVGIAFLGAGFAMIPLPGPGFLVILIGFIVLATEFVWAERALDRVRGRAAAAAGALNEQRISRAIAAVTGVALIIGGGFTVVIFDSHRVLGASVVFAGIFGLVVLLPWTVRMLGSGQDSSDDPLPE